MEIFRIEGNITKLSQFLLRYKFIEIIICSAINGYLEINYSPAKKFNKKIFSELETDSVQ